MSDTPTASRVHRRAFLRARWENLIMMNYEAPAELLQPIVPSGVELDRWNGRLYVSVVGFRFADTKVLGVAVPGHRAFEEVNLRFYVRRRDGAEWRRGVVFVRELVPRRAIALVARAAYNEPYLALEMSHRYEEGGTSGLTRREYAWRAEGGWTRIWATTRGEPRALVDGSEEEFITEHYWGYTRQRDGGTVEYRVDHPRWSVWQAQSAALDGDTTPVYGPELARVLRAPPRSVFVADGSAVTVFAPRRIAAQGT